MSDDYVCGTITLLLIVVLLILGMAIGNMFTDVAWEKEAIKKGYAEYNQTTGAWQWKEIKSEKQK